MGDFTPWSGMANQGSTTSAPTGSPPSTSGTARDFANMLNQKLTTKKRKHGTHWELPKKLKLG